VDASAGTVGVTMDRRWNSLAMDTSGPEFQRGESAISADGGPSRMDMLAAIQVNPYGWDRAAPAAPRRPQAGWSVEGLQDWWNTPVLPGQRGGMFPSGTDIYGREVTAAPEPFVNALAGAQNIGDSVSAASRGEMGRAYTPDEFQTASGQMMDLAGTAALGTAPAQYATMPGNSVGMFAGRRAKTADLNALARAEAADAAGAPREQVWNDTGWFKGVDGKWRWEIDDSGALSSLRDFSGELDDAMSRFDRADAEGFKTNDLIEVRQSLSDMRSARGDIERIEQEISEGGNPLPGIRLSNNINHAELFDAYPDTSNMRTKRIPATIANTVAAYSPGMTGPLLRYLAPETLYLSNKAGKSSVLHEVQHAIQKREDFTEGGGSRSSVYQNLAGEVEARAVQARMDLTADQRRARPPWLDYDVPEANQIVRNGGDLFANDSRAGVAATAMNALARDIGPAGYYSGALEAAKALKQAKGTPEQMLAQLKAGGAKQNEIEATNLAQFLDGKKSVTRDEIVKHLTENRVGVKEVQYGGRAHQDQFAITSRMEDRLAEIESSPEMMAANAAEFERLSADYERVLNGYLNTENKDPKWANNSLDPSNPTYRETVLHLPRTDKDSSRAYNNFTSEMKKKYGADWLRKMTPSEQEHGISLEKAVESSQFTQGHFPEPNIIGHMMTSMTKHEGKPVYTIDQIQSDWGQKLRDGGVRDEKKIADLKIRRDEAQKSFIEVKGDMPTMRIAGKLRSADGKALPDEIENAFRDYSLLDAELSTAEASAFGNPLVNTTDQWTNTTLRKALMQAADADADYVAIPRGDTVLSYNPGDTDGMRGFYDGIVPKNARNIMQKELGYSPNMLSIDQLETPSGLKGQGFTLMDLPPEIRAKIKRDGMRMFANPAAAGVAPLSQDEPRRYNALAR
jgi:hypothetical protein